MVIQFGSIVTAGAGKVGGQIIQRGTTGQILRTLTPPKIRTFQASTQARNDMSYVSSNWRALAPADKTSWSTLAASLTRYNKFGVPYTPNGFQVFCELNLNSNYLFPSAIIETAPAPIAFPSVNSFSLTANPTGPVVELDWNYISSDPSYKVLVSFYPLQSKGVTVPRGSSRFSEQIGDIDASYLDLTAAFVLRYGTPRGGEWQFAIQVKIISVLNGWAAPSFNLMAPYSSP